MSMRYKGSRLSATANTPTSLTASGAWTLQQQMQANGTSTWPFVRDPQFNYVTMLLHGDGSAGANNGSGGGATPTVTAFDTDASTNNFNLTINGDARSDNFNPYQSGYYSNSFNGSSSYLGVSAATIAATGQFCIEAWVYQSSRSTGTDQMIFSQYTGGVSGRFYLRFNVDKLSFTTSAGDNSGATTLNTNVWYHVAVTRDASNVVRLFVNGVLDLSATVTQSLQVTTPQIGAAAASSFWNGFISNLRTVSGAIPTSYQTSSTTVGTVVFTPSTSPLTTASQGASGTSLLTCQSNRFIDNSASVLTVTSTSTSIAPAVPFTLPSSVATYGSGYFDGTGDKLVTPASSAFNFGTGDFTVEMWVYPNATIPTYGDAFFLMDSRTNASWGVFLSSGKLYFANSSGTENNGGTIASFTWSHVAVSRASGTTRGFINGVQAFSFSDSGNYTGSPSLTIGGRYVTSGTTDLNGYLSNARIINGTGLYTTTFTPPSSPLTAVSGTSLLTTQFNGGGNNNGFKDSSQNNFVITRNGNTTQGTFAPYGSNWSNFFDGSGDYLTAPSTSGQLGAGDFTIECWSYLNSKVTIFPCIWGNYTSFGSGSLAIFAGHASGTITKYQVAIDGIFPAIQSTDSIIYNQWTHIALVRSGATITLYINGVANGARTSSVTLNGTSGTSYIGTAGDDIANGYINGYLSNLRVVKGTAVYTSAFTPPTTPLTAISGTSLLTCADNRFIDDSTNNFAITVVGSPSVQRFSPFANATAYNPATTGGSAYFDGGDYLTFSPSTSFAFGTGDFTIEFWVNTGGGSANGAVLDSTTNGSYWAIRFSGTTLFYQSASGITNIATPTISTLSQSAWTHVAIVRASGTTKIYANGVQVSSTADSTNYTATTTYQIGKSSDNAGYAGYFSDIRVVKGTAIYTTAFTPPTAPLTAITNTSLLTNYTNGAIFDNAMMNDLETVGNAQISTSVVKYGTASMYFDGTGDYLTAPASPTFLFSGNFTIECWFYKNGTGTFGGLFGNYTTNAASNWTVQLGSSNVITWYYDSASSSISSSTAFSVTTWNHVACVRSGSTLTLYLNGVSVGTATSSAVLGSASKPFLVGIANGDAINGYIDDLRVTNGYARYTTTFTPPTAALPNG